MESATILTLSLAPAEAIYCFLPEPNIPEGQCNSLLLTTENCLPFTYDVMVVLVQKCVQ